MDIADHMVNAASGRTKKYDLVTGKSQGPVSRKLRVGLIFFRLMLFPDDVRVLPEFFPDLT